MKECKPFFYRAQYYETDQMGVVHHSNYIRWMESARVDAMKQMGLSYRAMEEDGVISPVISIHCDYKSMVRFDDEVSIQVRIVSYNGMRLTISYEIRTRDGVLCTRGESSHCFLNREGKLISLKRECPQLDACFRAYTPERSCER